MANEATALMRHALDRFGVVTVMDVLLKDPVTGAPIIELDTLKVTNISGEGKVKDITGGLKADTLISYDYGRTAKMEIKDAVASLHSLATLWGGEVTNTGISADVKMDLPSSAVGKITLPAQMSGGTPVPTLTNTFVYNMDGDKLPVTAIDGLVLTVTGAAVDTTYRVYTKANYVPVAGFKPLQLTLKSNKFPPIVTLVGKTVVIEQESGKQIAILIEIPRFKVTPNINLTMDAEGEAATFDFSGTILTNTNKEQIIYRTLGYVDGVI